MSTTPVTDQVAHFAAALLMLLPAALWQNPLTLAWAGLVAGVTREMVQHGLAANIASLKRAFRGGSLRDISFWALGGFVAGLLS